MFNRTLSALGAAALAASALLAAAPAAAASASEDGVTIRYADLDLSNPADALRFDSRVRTAARDYCGQMPELDLKLQGRVRACRNAIVSNARSEITLAMAGQVRGSAIVVGTN
jgi:UrcA family protein